MFWVPGAMDSHTWKESVLGGSYYLHIPNHSNSNWLMVREKKSECQSQALMVWQFCSLPSNSCSTSSACRGSALNQVTSGSAGTLPETNISMHFDWKNLHSQNSKQIEKLIPRQKFTKTQSKVLASLHQSFPQTPTKLFQPVQLSAIGHCEPLYLYSPWRPWANHFRNLSIMWNHLDLWGPDWENSRRIYCQDLRYKPWICQR